MDMYEDKNYLRLEDKRTNLYHKVYKLEDINTMLEMDINHKSKIYKKAAAVLIAKNNEAIDKYMTAINKIEDKIRDLHKRTDGLWTTDDNGVYHDVHWIPVHE